jgi:hypothetical protein
MRRTSVANPETGTVIFLTDIATNTHLWRQIVSKRAGEDNEPQPTPSPLIRFPSDGEIPAYLLVVEHVRLFGCLTHLFDGDRIEIGEKGFARLTHGWLDDLP